MSLASGSVVNQLRRGMPLVPIKVVHFTGIGHVSCDGRCCSGVWRCEEHGALLGSHATREVSVCGRYASKGLVQASKGVLGTTEAGSAAWRCWRDAPSISEDLSQRLTLDLHGVDVLVDFLGGWHKEGRHCNLSSLQDASSGDEILGLASCAGTNIYSVRLDVPAVSGQILVVWRMRLGHHGFQLCDIVVIVSNVACICVWVEHFVRLVGLSFQIIEGGLIRGNDTVLAAGLNSHVAESHALLHGQLLHHISSKLHASVGGACHTNITNDLENHVLGEQVVWHLSIEGKSHAGGDLDKELSGSHDKASIGVSNTRGEHAKSTCIAGVGVRAKQNLTRSCVPLLSERNVTHALIVWVCLKVRSVGNIIKVLNALFLGEISEDVHVSVGSLVGREDVVVWNDDNLLFIKNLGVLTKLSLEDTNRSWTAHVVRHEHIDVDPDIISRLDKVLLRALGKNLLDQVHWVLDADDALGV
mmetsp:Transcript_21424/g.36832  ORF Transcript_21424/g.36832 Transcript_21424/m.36832 type:complete len:472 (-) Transcript_21424:350-1765(-)